jgi:gluconate 2-dehydrogenase gamma chain
MTDKPIQRRDFVKRGLIGVGGMIFLQRCSFEPDLWQFLTNDEAALLEAIAEQFIPTDDKPGAKEACVVNFIDTQLTLNYVRFQERYRAGLAYIQESSKQLFNKKFELLSSEQQITFLESMEKNNIPDDHWKDENPSSFFRLMLSHCMQGFYGDPRHGGNCNHVSYHMIELQVIQFYQPETKAS